MREEKGFRGLQLDGRSHVGHDIRCPHSGEVVSYKKGEPAGGFRRLRVERTVGMLFLCVCVCVCVCGRGCFFNLPASVTSSVPTARSCALSCGHRVWRAGWGSWPVTGGYRGAGCGRWALPRAPTPPSVRESCRGRRPTRREGTWRRRRDDQQGKESTAN